MNTYIAITDYLRAPSGHDTSTLVGNVVTLTAPASIGATSLNVSPATTVAQLVGDRFTVFDGSASEVVTLTAPASIGATSLSTTATVNAHAIGISLCSDDSQGSLADMIVNASAQIESYCRQPLLQTTHSNERLPLRSMRAVATRDYQLILRPKQYPVQSVTAVTATLNASSTLTFDATQAFIDADAQVVTLAQMTATNGTVSFWGNFAPPLSPTTPGWINVSYVAGYAYASLPYDVRQACIWLVSDLLSDRRNPTGAAEQQLGKEHLVTRLRGDTSGLSTLALRAYRSLDPYRQRSF